ncbi:hypothetical protein ACFQ9V_14145 [Leifsonia sp. NPDC056665]|uniref:hypothetical protein n=1 Tax=Leifsonia sp. NPDC056665 TaxID=3345901 RepID=UPI0036C2F7C6
MSTRTRFPIAVIAVALALSLGGCGLGGNGVDKETNLVNQRKAAVAFIGDKRGVQRITFTREGGRSGFGAPWAVNAVITIGGHEYQAILGVKSGSGVSEPLPIIPVEDVPTSVSVIYSDGSSEVIE